MTGRTQRSTAPQPVAKVSGPGPLPFCRRCVHVGAQCIFAFIAFVSLTSHCQADRIFSDEFVRIVNTVSAISDCPSLGKCPKSVSVDGQSYRLHQLDLNDDGTMELAMIRTTGLCGSAGCGIVILQFRDDRWVYLAEGFSIGVIRHTTRGYHDIMLGYRGKDFTFDRPLVVCWSGTSYVRCYYADLQK